MKYQDVLNYLYEKTPMFQKIGASAYKEGLDNVKFLDEQYGHPHKAYPTIHVAGTNGKGSVSHTIASVLQAAGYKVGLYTSPHLKDFSERIRINGTQISRDYVVDFTERAMNLIESQKPSFFEFTTMMAFCYFKDNNVDVAVIEVGLGGRLDSTNIITPVLSIITNISFDHIKQLGNTIESIATEKAGIIKPNVPVVVGEATVNLRPIYDQKGSPVVYAEDFEYPPIDFELKGFCQEKNKKTIRAALEVLKLQFDITDDNIKEGFASVVEKTGICGRWQKIGDSPTIMIDTAHNEGGIRYVAEQLLAQKCSVLRIVFGMVNDKDISTVLALMPKKAKYYFTNASISRALPAADLQKSAMQYDLKGDCYSTVNDAYKQACADASPDDFIFIGGSNFVVAEVL